MIRVGCDTSRELPRLLEFTFELTREDLDEAGLENPAFIVETERGCCGSCDAREKVVLHI